MDELRPTPAEPSNCPAESLVRGLRDKRRRFQELLATQRSQLESLEYGFERQVAQLRAELTRQNSESIPAVVDTVEFEAQRTALANEAESLAQLSTELDLRQRELIEFENRLKGQEQLVVEQLAQQQAELDERMAELDAGGAQIRQAQRALAASEEELTADREQVARTRQRLEEQLRTVDHQREEFATLKSETTNQRRRIARELQHQRSTQKAEITKERESLRQEREDQLAELNQLGEELKNQAKANHGELNEQLIAVRGEAEDLRRQIFELKKHLNARSEELSSVRAEHAHAIEEIELQRFEHDRLAQDLALKHRDDADGQEEQTRLRSELDVLRFKLAEAEKRAATAEATEPDGRKRDDMQRRFELAVEDIRDLKRRNAELEEQLAAVGESGGASMGGSTLDWESQKRRLLASLEADGDEDEEQEQDRMSIEGTIRITDEIVARKDREIAELKQVLEEQSSNIGTMAVGASAIASIFDQDELIKQERENLQRLQNEWRQKLREAEIDISVERARMARERAELDEKLQTIEDSRARQAPKDVDGKGEASGKPGERRWWARLGLKDGEH